MISDITAKIFEKSGGSHHTTVTKGLTTTSDTIWGCNIITSCFHGVYAACDGVLKLRSYPIFEHFPGPYILRRKSYNVVLSIST